MTARSASEASRVLSVVDERAKKKVQKARGLRPWMPTFAESEIGADSMEPSGAGGGAELVDIELLNPLPVVDDTTTTTLSAVVNGEEIAFRVGGVGETKTRIQLPKPSKRSVRCVRGVDYLDLASRYEDPTEIDGDFAVEEPEDDPEKDKAEDAALDRVFGTKAYLPSRSDGTITG